MIGITGVCSRLVQALGVSGPSSSTCLQTTPTCKQEKARQADELMIRALTAVFGMENNGKIKKEKARRVVEKLGLIYVEGGGEEDQAIFDLPGGADDEEVHVEEVLNGLEDGSDRHQLLQEAFKIFDENGNGYIEAVELKRVLQCLGLDKGWDMEQIQKMLKAADLNFDGMVDFNEFELMMG
ncbi:calmodulin-like protein 2 [Populus alba x Populus x berolinensis]|uniref:EF-hand domain-containing protein n=3 Tax=Populus TaxID=3689 RepID=A0A4U5PXE4_POPAL|nr:calmodulin-like protein 2 [Populus alba]KAJ6925092.1 calmodulin-like protein 2 [Populus alba x Populus x berolinensis]KAJ6995352.1 calmodulin-like protein 2 [Populus alba x Populus x berolinensis]TKS01909.1 hypothetical protein D5086_0000168370 [Populus alba]